jgi:hypothetical protein
MSMRRLWVLVSRLPANSATKAATSAYLPGEGGERIEWTLDRHLLAAILDTLRGLMYLTGAVHTARGKNPVPEPKPFPRPGIDPTDKKPARKRALPRPGAKEL